VDFH